MNCGKNGIDPFFLDIFSMNDMKIIHTLHSRPSYINCENWAKDITKVNQGSNTSKASVKIAAIIHFKDKIALLFQNFFFDNELLKKSNRPIFPRYFQCESHENHHAWFGNS